MSTVDINKKLDSFNNLIGELGVSNFSSKEIWNRQKEIAENFKAAQFETDDEKNNTVNRFQSLIESLKNKEKDIETANEQFTSDAESLLHQFEQNAKDILAKAEITKDDFKPLRENSNALFEHFKQQRWATKERRTTAWDTYNAVRNNVKAKEDELFAQERESKAKQQSQSLAITEKLCVVVNACHPEQSIEELQQYVIRFNEFLKENNIADANTNWFVIEKPEELKYSLRCRTETLNNIRNFISINKDCLTREHKGQVFANIDALKDDINKAWEAHKEEQQKRQEEWEIKKQEREEKRVEWNKKQQEFLKMLEGRLENQIAYKAKQESYLQSQKEYAQRFENRIPQQQDYIKKLIEQVIDLEKKYATAWTDSFKTKVEEWIKEKKDKIATVEADIETLKEKIADINKKSIDEIPKKIEELNASIEEIKSKIVEVKEKLANDDVVVKEDVVAVTSNEAPQETEPSIEVE